MSLRVARVTAAIALCAILSGQGSAFQNGGQSSPTPPASLSFAEFFDASATTLQPSAKLRRLAGTRVRVTGFMVQMEEPPLGGFYFVGAPLSNDESGGGTGDLPPATVFVVVRSAAGTSVRFIPLPIEVTGVLELGYREEPDGRVSRIRILLDRNEDLVIPGSATPR